jgi:hypothetical protein
MGTHMTQLDVVEENVRRVIPDESQRNRVIAVLKALRREKDGGMTLNPTGKANGAIVVAHGVPSMADEKTARQEFKEMFGSRCQLSRTLDVAARTAQYAIAGTVEDYHALNDRVAAPIPQQQTVLPSQPMTKLPSRSHSGTGPTLATRLYKDPWIQIVVGGVITGVIVAVIVWAFKLNK